ncbi:putative ERGIC-53 like protein [Blattamonas nauphoetae]|uniref:ERGIC-53 like protein n=1 Tax=Blattamonas nauphoetae TaxID=2049346 RepID=A0ABQ9X1M7_9EUKA|nr:putative ERGIC-53 like protein [Blattamonas nauphoetae]
MVPHIIGKIFIFTTFLHALHLNPPFLHGRRDGQDEWSMGGTASTMEDRIRLTNVETDQKGCLWSIIPNSLPEWEVNFEIQVFGGQKSGADGMAFWYSKIPSQIGSVYGGLDKWEGLGLFFDTYDNRGKHQNPSILAVINDGTISYDHPNDGVTQQAAGVGQVMFRRDHPFKVRVIYSNRTLSVASTVSINGVSSEVPEVLPGRLDDDQTRFTTCFVANDIDLPSGYYFGFSGATGGLSDNHDVISFDLATVQHKHPRPSPKQSGPIKVDQFHAHHSKEFDSARIPQRTEIPNPKTEQHKSLSSSSLGAIDLIDLKLFKERLSRVTTEIDLVVTSLTSLKQSASEQSTPLHIQLPDDIAKKSDFIDRADIIKKSIPPQKTSRMGEALKLVESIQIPGHTADLKLPSDSMNECSKTLSVVKEEREGMSHLVSEMIGDQVAARQKSSRLGFIGFLAFVEIIVGVASFVHSRSLKGQLLL